MRAGAEHTGYAARDVDARSTAAAESESLHHAGRREEAARGARPALDGRAPARHPGGRRRRGAGRSQRERRVHLRQAAAARDRSPRALPDEAARRDHGGERGAERSAARVLRRVGHGRGRGRRREDVPDRRRRRVRRRQRLDQHGLAGRARAARQARRRRGHRARAQGRRRLHDRRREVRATERANRARASEGRTEGGPQATRPDERIKYTEPARRPRRPAINRRARS